MCLIIDANVAAIVFQVPCQDEYRPVWNWIERRGGILVFGGRNEAELTRVAAVRQRLYTLWQAGRAMQVPDQTVAAEERSVTSLGVCRSDDPHVIALARASGARVLCTEDGNLEKDFKNPQLVPRPRGAIYKNDSHAHLLCHNKICIGRPRRGR